MPYDIVFHVAATLLYASLALHAWRSLARAEAEPWQPREPRYGLPLALLLHGLGLQQDMLAGPALQINWAIAASASLWLGMIIFWLESLREPLDGLKLLLYPTAALSAFVPIIAPLTYPVLPASEPWLRAHLLIALASYGLVIIAALQAVLMTLLDRQLQAPSRNIGNNWFDALFARALDAMPPLLIQEKLLFRLISLGFGALTLAVVSGALISATLTGQALPLDLKTIFTLLAWLTFGILLIGRRVWGWRGRVAVRWTLAGAGFLALIYLGGGFALYVALQGNL